MQKIKVAFIGMSHLGLISSVCVAEKGFQVVGFDQDLSTIEKLNSNQLIYSEPKLPELLEKNKKRLCFTNKLSEIKKCDIVYISKDVPTNDKNQSDVDSINTLINLVKESLNNKAVLVILSQVPPGFTRKISFDKSRLFYQVETLIFGRAVERALLPERIIIGCEKKVLHKKFMKFLEVYNIPIFLMNYDGAELSKIAINMYLVSSISTTNTLAELCEKLKVDWDDIIPVLQSDKRIGKYAYLKPGLGIAGGNLERDLITFASLAKQYETEHSIVDAWRKNSQHRANWVLQKLKDLFIKKEKKLSIGILGLAYKENTASIKNSCSLHVITYLKDNSLYVFDPIVKELPNEFCFVNFENSIDGVCRKSDVLIIMTPWNDFQQLNSTRLFELLRKKVK